RCVVAGGMFGNGGVLSALTIQAKATSIKTLFVVCSEHGILASDLHRFPLVAEQYHLRAASSRPDKLLGLLHDLWGSREDLGFTLLDRDGLKRLALALPEPDGVQQTPYIPARIWLYQLGRLRTFLEDFQRHRRQLERLFNYCIRLYVSDYGSLEAAWMVTEVGALSPFSQPRKSRSIRMQRGSFADAAANHGVSKLVERWCLPAGESLENDFSGVSRLSSYFTQVGVVGTAYLANLSGMRIEEAMSLRSNCLQVEHDEQFGDIYLLCGETTKTQDDDDARWVTSRSASLAVESMALVARLRMICAAAHPRVPTVPSDLSNPWLFPRAYEPWGKIKAEDARQPLRIRQTPTDLADWRHRYPNLFDPAELVITEADLEQARLITPSLDPERYAVGLEWPLAYHQLRRTTAVNMAGSGVVSDASLQSQLKHETRAQSLYYGQGYSRLKLNRRYREEYIRTAYEMLALQASQLVRDRFVSPFGAGHKTNLLRAIHPKDSKQLLVLATRGEVSLRDTLLGLCMKRGPCEYGGIENVVHCPTCADALLDRQKLPRILAMKDMIEIRLVDTAVDSPLHESL
ncbi:MAG: hypothetical protein A2095_13705, partial [Sphingomonadales bacterium GWF1_63_6]